MAALIRIEAALAKRVEDWGKHGSTMPELRIGFEVALCADQALARLQVASLWNDMPEVRLRAWPQSSPQTLDKLSATDCLFGDNRDPVADEVFGPAGLCIFHCCCLECFSYRHSADLGTIAAERLAAIPSC